MNSTTLPRWFGRRRKEIRKPTGPLNPNLEATLHSSSTPNIKKDSSLKKSFNLNWLSPKTSKSTCDLRTPVASESPPLATSEASQNKLEMSYSESHLPGMNYNAPIYINSPNSGAKNGATYDNAPRTGAKYCNRQDNSSKHSIAPKSGAKNGKVPNNGHTYINGPDNEPIFRNVPTQEDIINGKKNLRKSVSTSSVNQAGSLYENVSITDSNCQSNRQSYSESDDDVFVKRLGSGTHLSILDEVDEPAAIERLDLVRATSKKLFACQRGILKRPSQSPTLRNERTNRQIEQLYEIGKSPGTPLGSTSTSKSGGSGPHGADSGHPDSLDGITEERGDPLGPLPPNWEKAVTEKGDIYFIDHGTGTSHWLDPRLSKVQKPRPEDCCEDELPFGWERIDDHSGTYFIDHVNRKTQYENPVLVAKSANQSADVMSHIDYLEAPHSKGPLRPDTFTCAPLFTRNPNMLPGERLRCELVKSTQGLGFTIVGGDDKFDEVLQIKSVLPNGPAWLDGRLKTGDVLIYVNDTCVLGFTHNDVITMFQSIASGESVGLEVCRGYPLPFDPDDPNTEIVTTVAVTSEGQNVWEQQQSKSGNQSSDVKSMPDLTLQRHPNSSGVMRPGSADIPGDKFTDPTSLKHIIIGELELTDQLTIPVIKGGMGFGFTIADSAYGQKVKKILDRPRCRNLQEGDILVDINTINVRGMSHSEVVQVLKDCSRGQEANITIQRGLLPQNPTPIITPPKSNLNKRREDETSGGLNPRSGFLYMSKTPSPELYSTQEKDKIANSPKTPLAETRYFSKVGNNKSDQDLKTPSPAPFKRNDITRASMGVNKYYQSPQQQQQSSNYYNALPGQMDSLNMGGYSYQNSNVMTADYQRARSPGRDLDDGGSMQQEHDMQYNNYNVSQQQKVYGYSDYSRVQNYEMMHSPAASGGYPVNGCDEESNYGYTQDFSTSHNQRSSSGLLHRVSTLPTFRKETTSYEHSDPLPGNLATFSRRGQDGKPATKYIEMKVTLHRQETGFGFRIVGGTEEGSQVSIGLIVPGGAADLDGRLCSGDEIVAVDDIQVFETSHHQVVGLVGQAGKNGMVTLTTRRKISQSEGFHQSGIASYPYNVTVTRYQNEGFGFVIISSASRAGSMIGRIIEGSPAERCGRLQIGDRILAVNQVDINSMHHDEIVNLVKDSGYSVVLTVGPPIIDDALNTASTLQREDHEFNMSEKDDLYYAVELDRGTCGFGFSIRGGREFQSMPVFVLRIAADGSAAADGRLRVGDQLIEINGMNTQSMTHAEAIESIKSSGNIVRLLVRRCKMTPPAFMEQFEMPSLSPRLLSSSASSFDMMAKQKTGQGYLPSHLPTGILPLPGLTTPGLSYFEQGQGTLNGYSNSPVSHGSQRMDNNNCAAENYYYNQY